MFSRTLSHCKSLRNAITPRLKEKPFDSIINDMIFEKEQNFTDFIEAILGYVNERYPNINPKGFRLEWQSICGIKVTIFYYDENGNYNGIKLTIRSSDIKHEPLGVVQSVDTIPIP